MRIFCFCILCGWLLLLNAELKAQPLTFTERAAGSDAVFGVTEFSDSFLLIGVRSQDELNTLNLRIVDLHGKVLKKKIIGCGGKWIIGSDLRKIDDHFFLLFQTDFGKTGTYGGFGIVKLNSCLDPVGSMVFYTESEDAFIHDIKRIDSNQIAITLSGVSDNHVTLVALDHTNWQYRCSRKVFRNPLSALVWVDSNALYVTGSHYSTKNDTLFSLKLGVHKFDEILDLSWYKSLHQDNSGIFDQVRFVDHSQVPWKLWGSTRKNGMRVPIVYLMDSSGRIWDSIDLESTLNAHVAFGNTVNSGEFSLMTMIVTANLMNQYVVINSYDREFSRNANEIELFNPNGSSQVYDTYIQGVSTLYDSLFLVYGVSNHPGSKGFDGFCTCYNPFLDTCIFLNPSPEMKIPCIAGMDSVSYLTLIPDTVVHIPDSIFQKDKNFDSFILSIEQGSRESICSIFPNPGNGSLWIELEEQRIEDEDILHLQVYSVRGELLKEQHASFKESAYQRLEQLPVGIYFIKIIGSDGSIICQGKYQKIN